MEEARQTESAWEVRLGVPEPELDKLSLASARPRRLRAWLDALPIGDPHRGAPPLLTLLDELPRLRVDGRRRLALLEEIRPRLRQLAWRAPGVRTRRGSGHPGWLSDGGFSGGVDLANL